jgi:hypothetical protein
MLGKSGQEVDVMKGMVRCKSLDMAGLAAQEKHGKREDRLSQKRRVRDADPFVFQGLDLKRLYDAHVEGARFNGSAKKTVLHFIVRFPPELLDGERGPYRGTEEDRQALFLQQAVQFINETHGGRAVFAGRVDRDETGKTIADVFATPVYEKRTKRTDPDKPGDLWASATKFGKELAEKHEPELLRRHPKAKGKLTAPRMVGIALQSEFHAFFERVNGFRLDAKREKGEGAPDRLEKEAHDRLQAREGELRAVEDRLRNEREALEEKRALLRAQIGRVQERERELKGLRNLASELIQTLRGRFDLPRDLNKGLFEGLRELREMLKPKKPLTELERIVQDIESRIPERSPDPFDQSGPGF